MGFMEDLGRSNALSGVNGLLGKAMEMRQGDDRSAERAYSLGMESEKLGMLKDEHELDMNKKKMEFKRLQEEEANAQFKTDVSTNPIIRNLPPDVQKDALKWGQQQGYWDENNIGSRRNQKRAYEELTNNKEVFQRFMWPAVQAKKSALEAANEEINVEMQKDSPNAEKIAKMKQRAQGLQKAYDLSTDSYSKAQEHFDKIELEKEKQGALKNAKVALDKNSETGYSYYDNDGKVMLKGAPKPASAVAEEKLKETSRHNKAWEALRKSGGSGSGATALMKNTEFLTSLGWKKEDAAKMLASSKPMSKDSFIGQTTMKIMTNEMILPEEKAEQVQRAIEVYDSVISKGVVAPPGSKILDDAVAASIFKESGNDPKKARELAKKRGYKVQ